MKTAILFLHGSGGTGPELQHYLNTFRIPQFNSKPFSTVAQENNFDLLCPSSAVRKYTPAGGERMNVWYDRSANFISLGRKDREYESSVTESINEVCIYMYYYSTFLLSLSHAHLLVCFHHQISRIIKEIESRYDRIVVGGFSMGGGLALNFIRESVRPSSKICAVFSIGGFLVENSLVFQESIQTSLPVNMMHGNINFTLQTALIITTIIISRTHLACYKAYAIYH